MEVLRPLINYIHILIGCIYALYRTSISSGQVDIADGRLTLILHISMTGKFKIYICITKGMVKKKILCY